MKPADPRPSVNAHLARFEPVLALTLRQALRSPDPSTQNGAVLVDDYGEDLHVYYNTLACNQFPLGVRYLEERWERPTKYQFIEHAERGSIYAAARNGQETLDRTLVCPWAACDDCARGIIEAGLRAVVTFAPKSDDTNARWDTSITAAMQMLKEAGVQVHYWQGPVKDAPPIRRNGELWQP